jgi:hypothetical protein
LYWTCIFGFPPSLITLNGQCFMSACTVVSSNRRPIRRLASGEKKFLNHRVAYSHVRPEKMASITCSANTGYHTSHVPGYSSSLRSTGYEACVYEFYQSIFFTPAAGSTSLTSYQTPCWTLTFKADLTYHIS